MVAERELSPSARPRPFRRRPAAAEEQVCSCVIDVDTSCLELVKLDEANIDESETCLALPALGASDRALTAIAKSVKVVYAERTVVWAFAKSSWTFFWSRLSLYSPAKQTSPQRRSGDPIALSSSDFGQSGMPKLSSMSGSEGTRPMYRQPFGPYCSHLSTVCLQLSLEAFT